MSRDSARSESTQDAHQRIRDEHESLKEVLERLASTTDLEVVATLLKDLRGHLAAHFEHEEGAGGMHDAVSDPNPHLEGLVKEILAEHREFLNDLDGILEGAREVIDVTTPNILLDVANLTRRLHDHEIRETELLTDAKFTDLGDKD